MLWIKLLAQQLLTSRTEVALTNEDNEGQRKRIGALAGPINQARGTIEEPEVELKSNGLCKHDYRSGSPPPRRTMSQTLWLGSDSSHGSLTRTVKTTAGMTVAEPPLRGNLLVSFTSTEREEEKIGYRWKTAAKNNRKLLSGYNCQTPLRAKSPDCPHMTLATCSQQVTVLNIALVSTPRVCDIQRYLHFCSLMGAEQLLSIVWVFLLKYGCFY